jgi:hypothetical protein
VGEGYGGNDGWKGNTDNEFPQDSLVGIRANQKEEKLDFILFNSTEIVGTEEESGVERGEKVL